MTKKLNQNKWLSPFWYRYLFSNLPERRRESDSLRDVLRWKWTRIYCRCREHPYEMFWFNAGGLEPDTRCRNCLEDIG